ncbi:MAG TPA: hypothetical protein VIY51_24350 [Xanthobacteraceae bacterium]
MLLRHFVGDLADGKVKAGHGVCSFKLRTWRQLTDYRWDAADVQIAVRFVGNALI